MGVPCRAKKFQRTLPYEFIFFVRWYSWGEMCVWRAKRPEGKGRLEAN
jgi:hypothetical protein